MTFQADICGCFQHLDACCDILMFPCCQIGRLCHAVKGHPHRMDCCWCLWGMCFFPIIIPCLRCKVSDKYQLGEDACTSLLFGCLCPSCSMCQLNKELNYHGVNPGGFMCSANDVPRQYLQTLVPQTVIHVNMVAPPPQGYYAPPSPQHHHQHAYYPPQPPSQPQHPTGGYYAPPPQAVYPQQQHHHQQQQYYPPQPYHTQQPNTHTQYPPPPPPQQQPTGGEYYGQQQQVPYQPASDRVVAETSVAPQQPQKESSKEPPSVSGEEIAYEYPGTSSHSSRTVPTKAAPQAME